MTETRDPETARTKITTIAGLRAAIGRDLPATSWMTLGQGRIDAFADATDDHQWIHVDTARAATSPYGTTIAHGFLTLSLLANFFNEVIDPVDADLRVNYGLERVRFTAAVPVDLRVRGRLRLDSVAPRGDMLDVRTHVEVEVEGSERPAVVADLIILLRPADPDEAA
jgi:acyl dehydratase